MANRAKPYLIAKGVTEWAYRMSGFNQLGLWRHDLLDELEPDVKEALRRAPTHVIDQRNFRITRALVLDTQKKILPKEQWTKLEEDELYLKPYLEEVHKEIKEREDWDAE